MIKKSLRKILITSICLFTFFVISTLTNINKITIKTINSNIIEAIYQTVYLLDSNNKLVRYKIEVSSNDIYDKINELFETLKINSSKNIPDFFKKIIPSDAIIKSINIENNIVIMDISNNIFTDDEILNEKIVESLTYSITSIPSIKGLSLLVDGILVTTIPKTNIIVPEILTKEFGINKEIDINKFTNISKVITYYVETLEGNNYYVPVTKYINDTSDKMRIIIKNLSSNYISETNMASYLNANVELIDYDLENDVMILNFNEAIFDSNQKILEEVIYSISSSVFANYDANTVVFKVNGYDFLTKLKKDIE